MRAPASALGLLPGDRILTFNGEPVRSLNDVLYATIQAENEPLILEVQRGERQVTLGADEAVTGHLQSPRRSSRLGC